MKWLSKPSLRTLIGLGALAAVFMATRAHAETGREQVQDRSRKELGVSSAG